MSSLELEPEFIAHAISHRIHQGAREIDDSTAALAERVKMCAFSGKLYEVVHRRTLPKVNVGNNAHVGERF